MRDNPEKVMLFIFPVVTFGLFVVAIALWWLVQTYVVPH